MGGICVKITTDPSAEAQDMSMGSRMDLADTLSISDLCPAALPDLGQSVALESVADELDLALRCHQCACETWSEGVPLSEQSSLSGLSPRFQYSRPFAY